MNLRLSLPLHHSVKASMLNSTDGTLILNQAGQLEEGLPLKRPCAHLRPSLHILWKVVPAHRHLCLVVLDSINGFHAGHLNEHKVVSHPTIHVYSIRVYIMSS